MRIDLFSVQLLLLAVEHESIGQAAKLHNITASAASKRISQIEHMLGVQLLHRHRKGVKPTAAGQALVRHATMLLKRINRLEAELDGFARGERGQVRVCANTGAIVQHLSPGLVRFLTRHPQLNVELSECTSQEVLRTVERGDADFGVFNASIVPRVDLNALPFRKNPLVVAVPREHPLTSKASTRFHEIVEHPMIALTRDTTIQATLERAAEEAERTLLVRIRVRSLDSARRMVHDGLGISVLPQALVKPYLDHMNIRMVALDETWAFQQLNIALRDWEGLSSPARMFLDHLLEDGEPGLAR